MAQAKQTWEQFKMRCGLEGDFLAIINTEGEWVDSCKVMNSALWAVCMDAGQSDIVNDMAAMFKFFQHSGYSIVHSNMLMRMHEAGAVK